MTALGIHIGCVYGNQQINRPQNRKRQKGRFTKRIKERGVRARYCSPKRESC